MRHVMKNPTVYSCHTNDIRAIPALIEFKYKKINVFKNPMLTKEVWVVATNESKALYKRLFETCMSKIINKC